MKKPYLELNASTRKLISIRVPLLFAISVALVMLASCGGGDDQINLEAELEVAKEELKAAQAKVDSLEAKLLNESSHSPVNEGLEPLMSIEQLEAFLEDRLGHLDQDSEWGDLDISQFNNEFEEKRLWIACTCKYHSAEMVGNSIMVSISIKHLGADPIDRHPTLKVRGKDLLLSAGLYTSQLAFFQPDDKGAIEKLRNGDEFIAILELLPILGRSQLEIRDPFTYFIAKIPRPRQ